METDAYIALGSNLGDRNLNLLSAAIEIGKLPASKVTEISPFYETSPVGVTGQPLFLNAVLRLSTGLPPFDLLQCLQQIEVTVFNRIRTIHWGPRIIDLDLLLYGYEIIDDVALVVPHPRMAERRFVLHPLCNIAPDLIHPVLGLKMSELLLNLHSDEVITKI